MRHLWKPFLALSVVLAAFTLTFGWPKHNGLKIDIDTSRRAHAARSKLPYDLTRLEVMNPTILRVKENYVDPSRIDHRRMLLAGLTGIQRGDAPVQVDYQDGSDSLTVRVDSAERTFAVNDIDSPWALAGRFREVFAFLQKHLADEPDLELRDVEYAAVNGMLQTLDPHTILLTPDIFEEMQTSTRGEFGGLGIVISLRDGHLTVIKPMPGTPAFKAGIKRRDRIVKINDESTLNMPLSEAVSRLRGAPGSNVTVFTVREKKKDQWTSPKRVELTRAVIHIESVEHRMLRDGVGYVKINNFQGNTHDDLSRALRDLHKKGLRGLVLDLRSNPGGLLDQAVRVTDTFLSGGAIVKNQSQDPSQREERFAQRAGTEPDYPMVVLTNGASASASEIVAGALKNHDRAIVVGANSFGKGSVQVLYNLHDGSALKLTVAQYLTPGDVSIQGVGIVPDIAVMPMTVDRQDMDLKVDEVYLREADLRSHLTHESARESEGSLVTLGYFLDTKLRQRLREAEPNEEENEEEENFLIRFSRQLLARAKSARRPEMLAAAAPIIEKLRDQELAQVVKELRKLGVDWSIGNDTGPSNVEVSVTTDKSDNVATAGDPFSVRVKVANTGDNTLYQLRGYTKSDYRLFNGRELVFGKLAPGETREWEATLGICLTEDDKRVCRLPRSITDRADSLRIEFEEAHGHAPASAELRTEIAELPKPRFAYGYQIADNLSGNGDGTLQRGEGVTVYATVKNLGPGGTFDVQANLRSLSGRGILLQSARFQRKSIKPGKEWRVPFTFQILPDFEGKEAKLELSVVDTELRVAIGEKLTIPISGKSVAPKPLQHRVVALNPGSVLRESPSAKAKTVATVQSSVQLKAAASKDGFLRVTLAKDRPAWVAEADTKGAKGITPPGTDAITFAVPNTQPELNVDFGRQLVTRDGKIHVSGKASDDQRVRDLYVLAGSRKVFFRSNEGNGAGTKLEFETDVPLNPGLNVISVVARESNQSIASRTFTVRRDGKDGSILETPKYDDELFGADPLNPH